MACVRSAFRSRRSGCSGLSRRPTGSREILLHFRRDRAVGESFFRKWVLMGRRWISFGKQEVGAFSVRYIGLFIFSHPAEGRLGKDCGRSHPPCGGGRYGSSRDEAAACEYPVIYFADILSKGFVVEELFYGWIYTEIRIVLRYIYSDFLIIACTYRPVWVRRVGQTPCQWLLPRRANTRIRFFRCIQPV